MPHCSLLLDSLMGRTPYHMHDIAKFRNHEARIYICRTAASAYSEVYELIIHWGYCEFPWHASVDGFTLTSYPWCQGPKNILANIFCQSFYLSVCAFIRLLPLSHCMCLSMISCYHYMWNMQSRTIYPWYKQSRAEHSLLYFLVHDLDFLYAVSLTCIECTSTECEYVTRHFGGVELFCLFWTTLM